MDPQFWISRWQEGKIGFHEGRPNHFLETYLDRVPGRRVLVPMCGKSVDLAFLTTRNREVLGIELAEDAVRAFFAEHELTPTITHRDGLAFYTAGLVTVIAGDLFAVTPAHVGAIDAFYDRAALIALPAEMRRRYVAHLRTLVPAATRGLLITLEYAQDQMDGPPFAVLEPEVRQHYADVEVLDQRAAQGRVAELARSPVERCYVVTL